MNNDNIISELIKNISNSQVVKEPFAHQFIEKVFPEDFYLQLLDNIPNISEFIALNKTETVDKDYPDERFVFRLAKELPSNHLGSWESGMMELLEMVEFWEGYYPYLCTISTNPPFGDTRGGSISG